MAVTIVLSLSRAIGPSPFCRNLYEYSVTRGIHLRVVVVVVVVVIIVVVVEVIEAVVVGVGFLVIWKVVVDLFSSIMNNGQHTSGYFFVKPQTDFLRNILVALGTGLLFRS